MGASVMLGNNLSGLERARLLSDLPVQIGGVNWEDDKGHIASGVLELRANSELDM